MGLWLICLVVISQVILGLIVDFANPGSWNKFFVISVTIDIALVFVFAAFVYFVFNGLP